MGQDVGDGDEGHLRKVFNALDLNGDGEITIDELQQVIESLLSNNASTVVDTSVDLIMLLLH